MSVFIEKGYAKRVRLVRFSVRNLDDSAEANRDHVGRRRVTQERMIPPERARNAWA